MKTIGLAIGMLLILSAPVGADEWHVDGKVYHSKAKSDVAIAEMNQKAVQKAVDGGYVVNLNGKDYGSPAVMKRHKESKKFRYYNYKTGGTHQYGGANGKPVSREQFMRESEQEFKKFQNMIAAERRAIRNRPGGSDPESIERVDKAMDKAEAEYRERLDKDRATYMGYEAMDEDDRKMGPDKNHDKPWFKKSTSGLSTTEGLRGSPIDARPFGK